MPEDTGVVPAVEEGFSALGATGDPVATVQRLLAAVGFVLDASETERSYFGRSTAEAVRVAQQRLGLRTTGVVDTRTLEALRASGDVRLADDDSERDLLPGRLIDSATNEPLAGLIVRAYALADSHEGESFAEDETNAAGAFVLSLGERSRVPALRLRVVDPSVGELFTDEVELPADELILHVRSPRVTIADAAAAAKVKLPKTLQKRLAEAGIDTLADIRAVGGLARLPDLPVPADDPSVGALDALAALSILPVGLAASARLADAGLGSIIDVAVTPAATLVAVSDGLLDEQAAISLAAAARAQTDLVVNALTELRLWPADATQSWAQALDTLTRPTCGCKDCQEATSPLAYLADLLAYTIAHIRNNAGTIGAHWLQTRFYQPFGDLPAACESLDRRVRQIRIAIEVLRAHLNLTNAPQDYLVASYMVLLERNGTSYDELRGARRASPADRLALGRRLGILVPPRPQPNDPLDILLLDEHAPPGPRALTEEALERLFGLQSTVGDPLRPDPVPGCVLYELRRGALTDEWLAEDWPANPPPDLAPIVDPDLLGPGDFTTPDDPNVSNAAFELWEHRTAWVAARITAKDQERNLFSFDQMLGDQPVSGLNRATSVTELLQLQAKQAQGTPIAGDLQGLGLEQAGFDYIVGIVQLEQQGEPILDSEWHEVFSILTQNEKRGQFPAWRAEERARPAWMPATAVGDFPLVLGPSAFRLRLSVAQGGTAWNPTPWRSTWADRRRWVNTLRSRIERESAIQPALQQAVDAAEEAALVLLREWLVFSLPQPAGTTRWDWFTRHFQIDAHSDACRTTTRAEQAIETLQGALFGARNGLLDDPSLTLEADAFDTEWLWIGSYVTWRAAMLIFLYPEWALRPSLRRSQSPGFARLLAAARAQSVLDRAGALELAAGYASYFADVCSLVPVAAQVSGSAVADPPGPQGQSRFHRSVVAVGQASASGSYYFSGWVDLLQQSLIGGPSVKYGSTDEAYWTKIEGLRAASKPLGILAYQPVPGLSRIGLYLRERRIGAPDRYFFTSYDGTTWATPNELDPPALVRASETVGDLPAATGAGSAPWTSHADDRLIAADVDGDGAREIVVFAATAGPDGLPVAVLREQDGGTVVSWTGFAPVGWALPASGPVLLRTSSVSPAERLLLVNPAVGTPPAPALGLFGWSGNGLTLFPTSTTGWTVDPNAIFAGADLDGNHADELVAFSHNAGDDPPFVPTGTDVNVLTVSDAGFAFRGMQRLKSDRAARPNGPGQVWIPRGFDVSVDRAVRVRGRSAGAVLRDEVLVTWVFSEFDSRGNLDVTDNYVALLSQDGPPTGPLTVRLHFNYVQDAGGSLTWLWKSDDRFVTWGESLIVIGSQGIGVVRRNAQRDLVLASMTASPLPPAASGVTTTTGWTPAASDLIVPFDVDGDGIDELLVAHADGSAIGVLADRGAGSLEVRWSDVQVPLPDAETAGWALTPGTTFVAADLDGDGQDEIVAHSGPAGGGARTGLFRAIPQRPFPAGWQAQTFGPVGVMQLSVEPKHATPGGAAELTARRGRIAAAYAANAQNAANRRYLDEASYFVPVELALRVAAGGDSTAALDWFASLYDYSRAVPDRKIAYKLVAEESEDFLFERARDWLDDPLDPHAIAETRRNTYTRFTIAEIARCIVTDADAEFTRGTSESVARAEELYLAALALLNAPEFGDRSLACSDLIGELDTTVGDPEWIPWLSDIKQTLGDIADRHQLESAISSISSALTSEDEPIAARFAKARRLASEAAREPPPASMQEVVTSAADTVRSAATLLLADRALAQATESIGREVANEGVPILGDGVSVTDFVGPPLPGPGGLPMRTGGSFLPAPSFSFCIPPDPWVDALRRHIELALKKIRSCRSISGVRADLAPYAMPTAADTAIEFGDGSAVTAAYDLQPLPYRYATLVERAKQLVDVARQIEQSMVAAIEAGFLASYTEFLARQDLELAVAGTRLKELEFVKAADGISLAELQRDKAQMASDHITNVMKQARDDYSTKLTVTELQAAYYAVKGIVELIVALYAGSGDGGGGGGDASGAAGGGVGGFDFGALMQGQGSVAKSGAFGDLASAVGKGFEAYGQVKSFEETWREYQYQGQIAEQDIRIGDEQIAIARDSATIAAEDRAISQLRVAHATSVLDFLATKRVLTPDLYEWVAGVLQDIYRFFLQEATSMALLAERQLAFERQEVPPAFIQRDYWKPPADAALLARSQGDLKGLTGAERLLRDMTALDQYAFRTDQRKLQLRKTISAWQTDPFAFEQFRQTGVLRLATPSSLFDRERPGDYLRLVKSARISVLGLIPPGQGIQGTLETAGTSRVVTGGDAFRTVVVQRGPEAVGLTRPIETTGLFELDAQSELMAPFEGIGVDTTWLLTLPKAANPFQYASIADILLTIDYTALNSPDYRAQVIADLDPMLSGDRAFSFRQALPDQWAYLHNPTQAGGMTVKFMVGAIHFPPNIEPSTLEIHELALYFVARDGATTTSWATDLATDLAFQADDGSPPFDSGSIPPVDGLIGTLPGSAQPWSALKGHSPLGEWTIALPDTSATRQIFAQEDVRDMLFVITYGGELLPWPD